MGKFKELWNGDNHSFFRYAVVSTAVFFLIVCFFSEDNLVRLLKAGREYRRQNAQIEVYRKEISEMDRQIEMLSNDVDTLEEFARERFFFAAPGDDVYVLE